MRCLQSSLRGVMADRLQNSLTLYGHIKTAEQSNGPLLCCNMVIGVIGTLVVDGWPVPNVTASVPTS